MLTSREVRKRLNIGPTKLYALVREGRLPAVDISEGKSRPTYRFKAADVDAYEQRERAEWRRQAGTTEPL